MPNRNLLHCFGLRHTAQIDFRGFGQENICKLSDGNIITAGAECFRCAEMLLQPSFTDREASGIHNASSQSIMKCDADTCKDLHVEVVLYDGVTILQGIGEHGEGLQREIGHELCSQLGHKAGPS